MVWSTLGASVAGTSHRQRCVPCQDAFRLCAFGPVGEWLAIAAADGAGSASHSEVGATTACDELVRRVQLNPEQLLAREAIGTLFSEVRPSLFARAESLGVRPRE